MYNKGKIESTWTKMLIFVELHNSWVLSLRKTSCNSSRNNVCSRNVSLYPHKNYIAIFSRIIIALSEKRARKTFLLLDFVLYYSIQDSCDVVVPFFRKYNTKDEILTSFAQRKVCVSRTMCVYYSVHYIFITFLTF